MSLLSSHIQVPPIPEEFRQWGQETGISITLGTILGGIRQWSIERMEGPLAEPTDAPTKAHAVRALAEAKTQRLRRTLDGAIRGGLRIGSLAAIYTGSMSLISIYRGTRDWQNNAASGMITGSVFGAWLATTTTRRGAGVRLVKNATLGAALGGVLAAPIGLIQQYLEKSLSIEDQEARAARYQLTEDIIAGGVMPGGKGGGGGEYEKRKDDVIGAVISQIERSLDNSTRGEKMEGEGKGEAKKKGWLGRWKRKERSDEEDRP